MIIPIKIKNEGIQAEIIYLINERLVQERITFPIRLRPRLTASVWHLVDNTADCAKREISCRNLVMSSCYF